MVAMTSLDGGSTGVISLATFVPGLMVIVSFFGLKVFM